MDLATLIKDVGFPVAVCIILLWKLIPTINGLKDVVNNAVVVIAKLEGVVTEDSHNTRTMGSNIASLTTEIARLNKDGLKEEKTK